MAKSKIRHSSTNRQVAFDNTGRLVTKGFAVPSKVGATVSLEDYGIGGFHTTVISLNATPVTVGNTTGASFGSVQLLDFPAGRIHIFGGSTVFSRIQWTGEDIVATGSGDFSLGTTTTADATLSSTDANIQASTAMLDPFVGGVGTGSGVFATGAAYDGTATAIDLFLNVIIDDADVENEASDVVLFTGEIRIVWADFGDI